MTLKDQIRDEKLQYDINSEAAKISSFSSGDTSNYEYLTGEETLPSNQQQIIEQAKFTYSPLGKAFEKQIKTIEDQGKKQIDAVADLKPKEIKPRETKPNKCGDYFIDELAKIQESYKPIDFNDLTYNFKDLRIPPVGFIKFEGPLHIFQSIHNGDTPLEYIEKEQTELKKDLGRIKQGDPRDKSEEQKKTIDHIKNLYNSRQEVFTPITPKQMLQRLPISLAQIKAGNNSQSLLN